MKYSQWLRLWYTDQLGNVYTIDTCRQKSYWNSFELVIQIEGDAPDTYHNNSCIKRYHLQLKILVQFEGVCSLSSSFHHRHVAYVPESGFHRWQQQIDTCTVRANRISTFLPFLIHLIWVGCAAIMRSHKSKCFWTAMVSTTSIEVFRFHRNWLVK